MLKQNEFFANVELVTKFNGSYDAYVTDYKANNKETTEETGAPKNYKPEHYRLKGGKHSSYISSDTNISAGKVVLLSVHAGKKEATKDRVFGRLQFTNDDNVQVITDDLSCINEAFTAKGKPLTDKDNDYRIIEQVAAVVNGEYQVS